MHPRCDRTDMTCTVRCCATAAVAAAARYTAPPLGRHHDARDDECERGTARRRQMVCRNEIKLQIKVSSPQHYLQHYLAMIIISQLLHRRQQSSPIRLATIIIIISDSGSLRVTRRRIIQARNELERGWNNDHEHGEWWCEWCWWAQC